MSPIACSHAGPVAELAVDGALELELELVDRAAFVTATAAGDELPPIPATERTCCG